MKIEDHLSYDLIEDILERPLTSLKILEICLKDLETAVGLFNLCQVIHTSQHPTATQTSITINIHRLSLEVPQVPSRLLQKSGWCTNATCLLP